MKCLVWLYLDPKSAFLYCSSFNVLNVGCFWLLGCFEANVMLKLLVIAFAELKWLLLKPWGLNCKVSLTASVKQCLLSLEHVPEIFSRALAEKRGLTLGWGMGKQKKTGWSASVNVFTMQDSSTLWKRFLRCNGLCWRNLGWGVLCCCNLIYGDSHLFCTIQALELK